MGLKIRRDTAANWTANNPTIEAGEQTLETDTGKVKWNRSASGIAYNTLAYYSTNDNSTPLGGGGDVTGQSSSVDSEVALFSSTTGKAIKRATGSGIAKLTSGVLSVVTAPAGTIVGTSDTQTLTNKDVTSGTNTFPTFNQNTSGTAANLSGTPALPNGVTATTQTAADNSTKLATTAYADGAVAATPMPVSALCATTALVSFTISSGNVTQITGTTVDSASPAIGDYIIVKDAPASTGLGSSFSTQPGNGLYVVTNATTNLTVSRATAMSGTRAPQGIVAHARAGTTNVGAGFEVTTPSATGAFTYGTNNIQWTQFTGAAQLTAGTGISKSGNTLSLDYSTKWTAFAGPTASVDMNAQKIINCADPTANGHLTTVSWIQTATKTLTNTRVTPRVGTTASSATPTINTDNYDAYTITALAAAITSMTTNLSGTPTAEQKLTIRIKDNGTARAITWGASFTSSGVATLLATTVISKTHRIGLIWDEAASLWVCVAVDAVGY